MHVGVISLIIGGAFIAVTALMKATVGEAAIYIIGFSLLLCSVGICLIGRTYYLVRFPSEAKQKRKLLQEKYLEAMAFISAANGQLDGRELTMIRELLRDELRVDFTAKAAEIVCRRVAGDAYNLEEAFAEAKEKFTDEEKLAIMRISIRIAVADENLDHSEKVALQRLAKSLEIEDEAWLTLMKQSISKL